MTGASARPILPRRIGPTASLAACGMLALALTAAAMPALTGAGDAAFLALLLASGGLAFLAARLPSAHARTTLLLIVGIGLAMRLAALAAPPLLSTDIFRYVWDGRVQAAGINPYRYVPADPALEGLRDTAIYPFINRRDYAVTIYPPVAQMFFLALTRLAESPLAIKLGLIACEGLTVSALVVLLRRLDLPTTRAAAYAWHPLPVWEIAGGGHVDGLMVALMMLGIWLVLARGRAVAGAVAVALAALVKPFALLALPPLWRPWRWGMVVVVPLTAALAYLPYLSVGTGVLGFLATGYANEEGIANGWGFTVLRLWRGAFGERPHDTGVYLALCLGLLVAMSLRFGFRRTRTPAGALADINLLCLTFLFLASPEFPWYALLAVPFLAVAETAAGWVLTLGVFGLYAIAQGYGAVSYETRADLLAGATLAAAVAAAWHARMIPARTP